MIIELLNYIAENSKSQHVEIYAHNINFDGFLILDGIKEKNIIYDMFIRDYNLYWLKIIYLKVVITFRCSYKIISLPVSVLGKLISSDKKIFPYKFVNKYNLDYVGIIPNKKYFNSEEEYLLFSKQYKIFNLKEITIEYCFQDIEIVYKVLLNILPIIFSYSTKDILKKCYSFSSISYKIYSTRFDVKKITKTKNLIGNHEYIKNAYYGGRCEVFGNPQKDDIIHYFDYKGMYAQCMMEKFPYGDLFPKKQNLCLSDIGFHTIRFKTDDYLPFLPVRHEKLLFPNGELIGTYWYEEIQNAINNKKCEVLEHYSSLVFENEDYLFKEFTEEFMKVREKGIYYNIFGKNTINGLYGSFALNDDNSCYIISLNESEFEAYYSKVDINSFKKVGNTYIVNIKQNAKAKKILDKHNKWKLNHKKRNIAYAAIIASKARIKLNNSLELVIKNEGSLFYTDTDSIFAGFKENKINEKMGDIKWLNTYEDGVFIASKFYFLKNEHIKLKGVNNNNYSFNEIKNKFYLGENIEFSDQLSFLKSNYEIYQHFSLKKIAISGYDKRVFDISKKKTAPITLIQTNNV